jgi:hypothetical protein
MQSQKVKWFYYFVYNDLLQMQSVSFLNIITLFFQHTLGSS